MTESTGRGNSVKFFSGSATNSYNNIWPIYTVPVGKTFIVTDIVLISSGVPTTVRFGTVNNSQMYETRAVLPACTLLNGTYATVPCSTSFQGGIRFASGEKIGAYGDSASASMTISGYEF
ncbi:hypothetical protein D7X74_09315 [Corallococcus sp. CA047B]|nr:hypothetical protein D7X74_09315 [Corallococcus sp. CA047B]